MYIYEYLLRDDLKKKPQSKKDFCNAYADKAVDQYKLAKNNNLPNINWPVWTDDWNGHYNRCKTVSHDVANKENAKRQAYLDKNGIYGQSQTNSQEHGMIKKPVEGNISTSYWEALPIDGIDSTTLGELNSIQDDMGSIYNALCALRKQAFGVKKGQKKEVEIDGRHKYEAANKERDAKKQEIEAKTQAASDQLVTGVTIALATCTGVMDGVAKVENSLEFLHSTPDKQRVSGFVVNTDILKRKLVKLNDEINRLHNMLNTRKIDSIPIDKLKKLENQFNKNLQQINRITRSTVKTGIMDSSVQGIKRNNNQLTNKETETLVKPKVAESKLTTASHTFTIDKVQRNFTLEQQVFVRVKEIRLQLHPKTRKKLDDISQRLLRQLISDSNNIDIYPYTQRLILKEFPEISNEQTDILCFYTLGEVLGKMAKKLNNDDEISEMSEMDLLRLQMVMNKHSQFEKTLSNVMKKILNTQDSLIQNIK